MDILVPAHCAMQLRHKKCLSVICDHKWSLADGIALPHMASVTPVKKAKLRHKNVVDVVQISLDQCQCEVCITGNSHETLAYLNNVPLSEGNWR